MFYNEDIENTFKELKTSIEGLDNKEANKRLEKYGLNKLFVAKKDSKLVLLLKEFKDPMIIILIISAIVSFIISLINQESYTDSIIIILIVIINALMGYFQELKADKALEALKKMQIGKSKVIRDGEVVLINNELITVGDILLLEAGDNVPADCRIVESFSLKADESSLTGESLPVSKDNKTIKKIVPLTEKHNILYQGTNITYGKATAVVYSVGMDTEFGKIASLLKESEKEITPLEKKIEEISKVLSIIILIIIIIMFLIGLLKGMKVLEIFMLSLSLAVAAIPEGLPAVITITLSLGISSMAKKNTIVRKLNSIETLGCTEVICSDKTGTITQNKMTVKKIFYNNEFININKKPDPLLLKLLLFNNDVVKNKKEYLGDPTEVALYRYSEKYEDYYKLLKKYPRVSEIPFDSNRKLMSTINKDKDGFIITTKGSFEAILNRVNRIIINGKVKRITKKDKEILIKANNNLCNESYRVIAYAYNVLDKERIEENNLIFVGLVGMIDPPREDIKQAIRICKDANITPIMITGDSLGIGISIAKEIGIIERDDEAILGSELDKYTDEELLEVVKKYKVYARVTPNDKLRIVNAWKANNKVVAMTGDGVNDAPAIKSADIGIGMGITGTEVAKNVSDLILADDSFSSIVVAIREGRRIYDNIRNVLVYLLTGNITEILVVFLGLIFGIEIFIPIQLLYINLITDSLPAIALAFEKEEKNIMKRKVRNKNGNFFTPFLISRVIVSSVLKTMAVLLIYFINLKYYDVECATTTAFLTLVLLEIIYSFSCRNLKASVVNNNLFGNKVLNKSVIGILILNIVLFATPVKNLFNLSDLNIVQCFFALGVSILIFLVDEISKEIVKNTFKDE